MNIYEQKQPNETNIDKIHRQGRASKIQPIVSVNPKIAIRVIPDVIRLVVAIVVNMKKQ